MDLDRLNQLEEKLKFLIDSYQKTRNERDDLLRIKDENTKKISELEEKIAKLEAERSEILNIVNNLINLIDDINSKNNESIDKNEY